MRGSARPPQVRCAPAIELGQSRFAAIALQRAYPPIPPCDCGGEAIMFNRGLWISGKNRIPSFMSRLSVCARRKIKQTAYLFRKSSAVAGLAERGLKLNRLRSSAMCYGGGMRRKGKIKAAVSQVRIGPVKLLLRALRRI